MPLQSLYIHLDVGDIRSNILDISCKYMTRVHWGKKTHQPNNQICLSDILCNMAINLRWQAYKLGMYGTKYVWIFMGDFVENWLETAIDETGCTVSQITKAAEGYFIFETLTEPLTDQAALANLVIKKIFVAWLILLILFSNNLSWWLELWNDIERRSFYHTSIQKLNRNI